MKEITSTSNPRVRELVRLRQKASARQAAGSFFIEGERMVMDAPAQELQEIYVTRAFLSASAERLAQKGLPQERIFLLSDEAMARAADTKTPQGIAALARLPGWTMEDLLPAQPASGKAPLLLFLEDIQDPGNLGTMLRTAEAAGADGVILSAGTVDLFHPKTVRATMSAVFRVPAVVTAQPAGMIRQLRRQYGMRVFAACPGSGSALYTAHDYTAACAFVIGNEGNGLRRETILAADAAIHIPMAGQAESLNAAMSAGILLYEAARQRGF